MVLQLYLYMSLKGQMWPNQVIGGLFGIICLSLSAFAFIGAQSTAPMSNEFLKTVTNQLKKKYWPPSPVHGLQPAQPVLQAQVLMAPHKLMKHRWHRQ